MKKDFTAPFWVMLLLGVIAGCWTWLMLYFLLRTGVSGFRIGFWRIVSFFFLPVIMILEAFMYWIVRKRNTFRRDTWNHVLLFGLAYATIIVKIVGVFFVAQYSSRDHWQANMRIVTLAQLSVFWGLVIFAHIFFVRLLIKAVSKRPATQEETAPSENVLDDI